MSHARIPQTAEAISRTLADRCSRVANRKNLPDYAVRDSLIDELGAGFKHLRDEGFLNETRVTEDGINGVHIECLLYVPADNISVTFRVVPQPPDQKSEIFGDAPFSPSDTAPLVPAGSGDPREPVLVGPTGEKEV